MRVLAAGTTIAGYCLEALLGRGGMGVVYRARDLELDRPVALKLISPELVEDSAIRARFLREARAAAAVEHPHVIPIHAAGERDDVAFIAMRLVDGEDLRRYVRHRGLLAPERAVDLIEQAAAGLDAIHRAGFVHRDVKPANMLIDRSGHLYVTDFGLVKQLVSQSGVTSTGQWVGTLDYVAPEQVRGGRVDARTDVYALGGVLFFALTGKVPFEREGDEAKLWAQLSEPAPAPSGLRPELPRRFDDVVARAMRKSPDSRFPSAGDLARAARAAASGELPVEPERMVARGAAAPEGAVTVPGLAEESATLTAARPTTPLPPTRTRVRRWLLTAGAVALAAGAATVVVLIDREPSATGGSATTGPTPTATPTAVADVGPVTRDVGNRPGGVVYAAGDLWVVSYSETRLTRIDAATGKPRPQQPYVGRKPNNVIADGDRVWVTVVADRTVVGIDARSGKVVRRIELEAKPLRIRADATGLWVLMDSVADEGQLLRRFSRSGRTERKPIRLKHSHTALEIGAGSVWLAERARQGVVRLDARTGRRRGFTRIPGRNVTLTFDGGVLWVAVADSDTMHKLEPDGGRTSFDAGHAPTGTEVVGGRLYVAARDDQRVLVFDPGDTSRLGELDVPPNPTSIASDDRVLWVNGVAQNTVTRITPR